MKNVIFVLIACLLQINALHAKDLAELKKQYGQSPNLWPKAQTADGVKPIELAPVRTHALKQPESLVALGEKLFHDPILSRDKTVSCNTCHKAELHFSDGKRTGVGIDDLVGDRNTPAIIGIDLWQSFFWDGRAETAEQQALMPIENPIEMDLSIKEALSRLNQSDTYLELFNKEFQSSEIQAEHLAKAIVAFERTIDSPDTRYQRFITEVYKSPEKAVTMLSEQELEGLHLYRTKAKCMTCHEGPLLSDNEFHITGFHNYGRRFQDLGRYKHTKKVEDAGKFRTPTLLAVTATTPWMHNGLFHQFEPMIEQYNRGGFRPRRVKRFADDPLFPETTPLIVKLNMTKDEMASLVAFLKIL